MRLEREPDNPLVVLESLADSKDYLWRQVGFCANWALDNLCMYFNIYFLTLNLNRFLYSRNKLLKALFRLSDICIKFRS